MSQRHATPSTVTIAGVRFLLPDLPVFSTNWPGAYQDFLKVSPAADLACEVLCAGADENLAAEPLAPNAPWQFCAYEGRCELTRRAADGAALWRIRAPLAFDHAVVSWHPTRFAPVYGDYVQSWSTGLGLSLLVFRLRACGGLVLHGSASVVDGNGILCSGVSGAGKSTISRLLHAAGAQVLTDERPVLRLNSSLPAETPSGVHSFQMYGSPWPSSAGFAQPDCAPLRRIYFLEHASADRLTRLSPREAFSRLIHVTTIPWQQPEFFDPCLQTLEKLLHSVPCAVLGFRPTPDVVGLIRQDLRS